MPISPERLASLDADVLLLAVDPGEEAFQASIERNPLWRRLDAVRRGAVVPTDSGVWTSGAYSSLIEGLPDIRRAAQLAQAQPPREPMNRRPRRTP